jgi:ribonuclease E
MSRQRLRAGVLAGSTVTCPHCGGAGIVRSVESTALRLLRALEEEGEKNRASAVVVKVASDIALYALNQKRRELARIETEYGMEISFEPKEGMQAGNFELERTRSKEPGAQPRPSAVGIEAGFVLSDEPEDELPPEEEEEEEEEESAQAGGDAESEAEFRQREDQGQGQSQGERGGRRRRRRGGRGRGRDRDRGQGQTQPRPEGMDAGNENVMPAEASGEVFVGEPIPAAANDQPPEEQQNGQINGQSNGQSNGQPGDGEHRRRRRRRRGRRGGRDRHTDAQGDLQGDLHGHGQAHDQNAAQPGRAENPHPAPLQPPAAMQVFSSETDRFGRIPDEIDTTPSAAPVSNPGAPSAPVWSLKDDIPDTTPQESTKTEAAKPSKKGWWQRTFSGS